MPSQLQQVIAFCSKRYNENRESLPRLAKAYLAIVNFGYDLRISNAEPEKRLLAFLAQPHEDADLARACKEVLEQLARPKPATPPGQ